MHAIQSGALMEIGNRVSALEPSVPTEKFGAAQSDEALLRLCATGNNAAMEELVKRYQTPLYRFLARLLGSSEDAEDAVMDVFVRAWQNAPRFEYRAKVATWLYRIAINIARDMHSRRKSHPQDPWPEEEELTQMTIGSAEDDALHDLAHEHRSRTLKSAMRKLSESDRLLLVLYYFEERDYDEIKEITGLSYTVLKTRLARARRRLRSVLNAVEIEDGP